MNGRVNQRQPSFSIAVEQKFDRLCTALSDERSLQFRQREPNNFGSASSRETRLLEQFHELLDPIVKVRLKTDGMNTPTRSRRRNRGVQWWGLGQSATLRKYC